MLNYESYDFPIIYILTLNKNVITEDYLKETYFRSLWPDYEKNRNEETGKIEYTKTKKQAVSIHSINFTNDRWDAGKILASLTEKTYFCIAEFSTQFKDGTSYLDEINQTFQKIIKENIDKYDFNDVSDGLNFPIDKQWERNTGEKKPYSGFIHPEVKGILTGWMRKNNITIEEFLKNPRYILFLDSENASILEAIDDWELISDNVDEIYYV